MRLNAVRVYFYGDLSLFLARRGAASISVQLAGDRVSIKDLVESLGVPHTEIDALFVNDRAVGFSHRISGNKRVRVYPDASRVRFAGVKKLRPTNPHKPAFLVDVHLGKVARMLRLLGFDTVFDPALDDTGIIDAAVKSRRIILTRDKGILKQRRVRYGYYVRGDSLTERMRGIVRRYDLTGKIKPFARCVGCNGRLRRVRKERVLSELEPLTRRYYDEFYRCISCGKIYWEGSHHPRILAFIKNIT
ncbi:MAG: hypothetical protein JW844_04405 [Candidatus Omnitrophica bacterium]|nr:hypothetical protein [Candidatus Omnitrophota bacterium]